MYSTVWQQCVATPLNAIYIFLITIIFSNPIVTIKAIILSALAINNVSSTELPFDSNPLKVTTKLKTIGLTAFA